MDRVEMMDALTHFNAALKARTIKIRPTGTDPKIYMHADKPEGTARISYVRLKGSNATAIAIIVASEPIDGVPAFHIGCAVHEDQRGKGLGRYVLTVGLEDLRVNMAAMGMTDYWIESIVETENIASTVMTSKVLGVEPTAVIDDATGEPSLRFTKRVSAG